MKGLAGSSAGLSRRCRDSSAPFLWSDIGDGLRKRPHVTPEVLGCVLPFTEHVVGGRLQDLRAALLGVVEVAIDIRPAHHDTVLHLALVGPAPRARLLCVDPRTRGTRC